MMNIAVLFGAIVEEMHFVFVHFEYENRFTNKIWSVCLYPSPWISLYESVYC